jgi:hypothetical protein
MEAWESLGSPIIQGSALKWPIPLAGRGGTLWLRLPAVDEPELVSLGIADDSFSPPTRLGFKSLELKTHSQVISFEVPPLIESPFFAVRFAANFKPLDVHFVFEQMAILPDSSRPEIPFISTAQAVAPSEAYYDTFVNSNGGERFTRYSDTEWLGTWRFNQKAFDVEVDSDPGSYVIDPLKDFDYIFDPTAQDGLVKYLILSNLENQDVTLDVHYETEGGDSETEQITLAANAQKVYTIDKTRADVGRLSLRVSSSAAAVVNANVTSAYLLNKAPTV